MKVKKLVKRALFGLISIFGIVALLSFIFSEARPEGKDTPETEKLVKKIFKAINKPAWDKTKFVSWSWNEKHHYFWDRKRHLVEVKWKNNRVLLNPSKVSGIVYKNDEKVESDQKKVKTAFEYFINDAFWLNAPAKITEENTERKIVKEKGEDQLMVTYVSGGVTPGDSYLWQLDENGLPKSWKMWVKIIPIGGVKATWEDWITLESGAKIATNHKSTFFHITISNAHTYKNWKEAGYEEDPFGELEK